MENRGLRGHNGGSRAELSKWEVSLAGTGELEESRERWGEPRAGNAQQTPKCPL